MLTNYDRKVKEPEKLPISREEKINFLKKRENFDECIKAFYEPKPPFTDKQLKYHLRVINKLRECEPEERKKLFTNDDFLRLVHGVVKKWVEYRRAKVVDFERFKNEIKRESFAIFELLPYELNKIDKEKWEEIKHEKLNPLFRRLRVMKGNRQIVGVSKTLHHLLPDLIPPIDNEYILTFYGNKSLKDEHVSRVLDMFYFICKELNLTENDLRKKWDTSIPKLIDNAIVGYVRLYVKNVKHT